MFGGFGAARMRQAASKAQKPDDGWCECPKDPNELDHAKIASVLGSDRVVCMKCNRRLKLETKTTK